MGSEHGLFMGIKASKVNKLPHCAFMRPKNDAVLSLHCYFTCAALLTVASLVSSRFSPSSRPFKRPVGGHSEVFSSFSISELFRATLFSQSPAFVPRILNLCALSLKVVCFLCVAAKRVASRVLWRKSRKRVETGARNRSNMAAVCRGAREKKQNSIIRSNDCFMLL